MLEITQIENESNQSVKTSISSPSSSPTSSSTSSSESGTLQSDGSLLPFPISGKTEQLELVFRNLDCTIKLDKRPKNQKSKTKKMLSGISGIIRPGRLTAIMGYSGAGKTTLLSVLAGKSSSGTIKGDILVNGKLMGDRMLRKISGFVFRDDIILPTMTVREAIQMSALLRTPKTISRQERNNRVEDIISILHLEKAQMSQIGAPIQKFISGGERKRTAIGMEMVVNPTMLFLDEPTTGLDSFTALSVVSCLSKLAQLGKTVVATFHQPSTEIFNLFDDLLILSRGRVAYCGPAKDALNYFSRQGHNCPNYISPPDYLFMEVLREFNSIEDEDGGEEDEKNYTNEQTFTTINDDHQDTDSIQQNVSTDSKSSNLEAGGVGQVTSLRAVQQGQNLSLSPSQGKTTQEVYDERIESILSAWLASPEYERLIEEGKDVYERPVSLEALRKRAPFWTQIVFLLRRSWNRLIRNQRLIFAHFLQSVILSLVVGLSYINVSQYTIAIQNRNKSGALFSIILHAFYVGASTFYSMSLEKPIFFREYASGFYSVSAYCLSKLIFEIPLQVIWCFLYTIICYYMIGLNPAFSAYLMVTTLSILVGLCGQAYGIFGNALGGDMETVFLIGPLIMDPLIIISGVYVSQMPVFLNWIRYISAMYYAYSGVLQVEFTSNYKYCDPNSESCEGILVINELKFADSFSAGVNALFLIILCVGFWVAGLFTLYVRAKLAK